MKTIHIDVLDKDGLNKAIAELNAIRAEWRRKADLCCETIAAMLADKISENLSQIPYSDDLIDIGSHTETPRFAMLGAEARGNTVRIGGEEIVFVEFGAGIYHNGNGVDNPLSSKVTFETAIGSYGNGNGNKPYWFIAHNLISRGTPAFMPINNAIEAIKPEIPTIVRQVFV